jgi:hypothetical protein
MLSSIVNERSRNQSCGKGEVKNRILICDRLCPENPTLSKHDQVLAGSQREPAVLYRDFWSFVTNRQAAAGERSLYLALAAAKLRV